MPLTKYQLYLINAKRNKITENFTLFEICNSDTALLNNIDNRPPEEIIKNATELLKHIMQPVRDHFKTPVKVNCIYRCPELNIKVGGAVDKKTGKPISQHCKGEACDFVINGINLFEVFDWIKHNLDFDQLIYENSWIHVSYVTYRKNRKQSLKLVGGKYIPA